MVPVPLLCGVLLAPTAVAPPSPGPWAVFWSQGRTYAVDGGAGVLLVAPGYLSADADGQLVRHRVRVEAHRPGAQQAGLPSPASRRMVLEVARTPGRAWVAPGEAEGFAPPSPWPQTGALHDERLLVQFTGDTLSEIRFVRRTATDGTYTSAVEARTHVLPTQPAPPSPGGVNEALVWLGHHVPGLLPECPTRAAGTLDLRGPQGGSRTYLVLEGTAAPCAETVSALALGPAPLLATLPPGVGDRRTAPDGRAVLLLAGDTTASLPAWLPDIAALSAPCTTTELRLERPGAEPLLLGEVGSLDGLRWLTPGDPLERWLSWVFAPVTAGCGVPVSAVPAGPSRLDGDLEDWPAESLVLSAALCRLVESGRVWAGPTDLSGAAAIRFEARDALVAVDVRDLQATTADGVRLLLPRGDIFVERDGGVNAGRLGGVRAAVEQRASGYAVEVRLPRELLGTPPSLAIAVDDVDEADPPGAGLRLWLAGEPRGRNAGRPLPVGREP